MKLTNKQYDILKWIALIALPAVGKWGEYAESLISRWKKKRKHDKVAL